ncbi:hypothetical protein V6N13_125705 [Hibiscus sabdariffa]
MAGKQVAGEGLPGNIAGMSKNQLYEIIFLFEYVQTLIEQNQQQAKQILVQNPLLTKALFQAQVMLGMVKPPQMTPTVQPPTSQQSQQSSQPPRHPNIQPSQSLPGKVGLQEQAAPSQTQPPVRKQHQNQAGMQISAASVTVANLQSQPMSPHSLQTPQQTKGHLNPPVTLPHTSQLPNVPSLPKHSSSQCPPHQTPMPTSSSQMQQSLQRTGVPRIPSHPPMQPQARHPSVPNSHHQYAPQLGPNVGLQHPGPQHLSQPMFHAAGGLHLGSKFHNQVGGRIQTDEGSSRMFSQQDNTTPTQLQGPSLLVPGQIGLGNQPPRPALLNPEMEKALLQQVMSLTPEQIYLLPAEQRNQVLQLQQILRK